ncbi:ninjurin-A [Cylas formicarius]|uniref:ninjurin-A n=1 Tax=Cylas formicarius TaxID=197179 RepID=UPI0029587CA3|nr:ninjurin-A [Cylas formicarius]
MSEYSPLSVPKPALNSPNRGGELSASLNPSNSHRFPSPENPRRPLLNENMAPLARNEVDNDSDEREVVDKPYPGIDDGFFGNGEGISNNTPNDRRTSNENNPDVEFIPTGPKEPEPTEPEADFPEITPRLGPDDGRNGPDEFDGKQPGNGTKSGGPNFPFSPGFGFGGFDVELGSNAGGETIPDLNVYQHKKTLAQGMMDLALFSANANQLRYVLETFKSHPYYYPSLVLISISLILQVVIGVGLIWNAAYNVKDEKALCRANKINNFTIIFLVTVINVFISAFGVASPPS